MPVTALSDEAPVYERPFVKRAPVSGTPAFDKHKPVLESLEKILAAPDMASRRWIWEQYDNSVMNDTVQRPGGDAAVVRVHGTKKALAITTDVTPRYCRADPFEGGKQAVAEAWRNLTAVGATPLAVTDNLNYGNPQKPEIMWEIVAGIDGIGEACRALDFPVIGGNCSLYNETNGEGILPTPAIGGVGLLKDVTKHGDHRASSAKAMSIILIGETRAIWASPSICARSKARKKARAPPVDLAAEKKHGDFVRGLIEQGRVDTVHDVSDGGLLVAVAEMALAGDIGADIGQAVAGRCDPLLVRRRPGALSDRRALRRGREDRGRRRAPPIIPVAELGKTGGDALIINDKDRVALSKLRDAHEGWFPRFMARRRNSRSPIERDRLTRHPWA